MGIRFRVTGAELSEACLRTSSTEEEVNALGSITVSST